MIGELKMTKRQREREEREYAEMTAKIAERETIERNREESELVARRNNVFRQVIGSGDAYGNGAIFYDTGSGEAF